MKDTLYSRVMAQKGQFNRLFIARLLVMVVFIFVCFTMFVSVSRRATAATSGNLNFQARLLQSSGALVPDGNYSIEFKLYDVATLGTSVWDETQGAVTARNGYLSVNLGSATPFPNTIDWTQEHWLTMNVNGDGEMSPRIKLTAVPYAFSAGQLGRTESGNKATLSFATPTGARSIVLPDASGTVAISASGNIALNSSTGNLTITGQIGLGNGGTGASDQQGAINALSGLTTNGDLLYNNGTNSTRLARGNNGECLIANGTTILWGSCSGTPATLQNSYTNSTNPQITLNSTQGVLTIQDNATPLGTNLFEVTNNGGATKYLAVSSSGVSTSGTLTSGGTINTTGGAVQTNSTDRIENDGDLVNIGNITGSGAVTMISGGTGSITIRSAHQSVVSTNSAVLSLTSGNAAGATSNSGDVTIDVGTATSTTGVVNIGNTNASGVTISRSGITTTVGGTLGISGASATVGATGQAGTLVLHDGQGSGRTATLQTPTLGASRVYTLPDESGTLCTQNDDTGCVRIARGSAQVDSTANDTISLNKTNATGNLLTLQRSGTGVFSIFNSGAVEMRLTNTAAFVVKNASGTNFFNIDTSGNLITIGDSSDDVGVLLILDTKTGATDPGGVNGGLYYNANVNRFRCYENAAWRDCLAGNGRNVTIKEGLSTASAAATNLALNTLNCVSDPSLRVMTNFNGMTKIRFQGRFGGAVHAATTMRLQYNTSANPAVATGDAGWTTLDTSAGGHTVDQMFFTDEATIPTAAQVNPIQVRACVFSGNGAADPRITNAQINVYP